MKANLCLHAGGHLTTLDVLRSLPTPPVVGKHVPVSHAAFLDRTEKLLAVDGFTVLERQLAIAKDGARMFALLQLEHPSLTCGDGSGYIMGLRNSHDKAFAASVTVGRCPFVCDNLAFSPGADGISVNRRHTGGVHRDLNGMVGELIVGLCDRFKLTDARDACYRGASLTQRDADHFILQLYRNGAIGWNEAKRVLAEYDGRAIDPDKVQFRHEEFAPRNAYSLFNALTQIAKGIDDKGVPHPDVWSLPGMTAKAYAVFDQLCAFNPAGAIVI